MDIAKVVPYIHKQGFISMASISPVTVNQPITIECGPHPKIVPNVGHSDSGHVDHSPRHPTFQFRSPIPEPQVVVIEALSQDRGGWCTCFHL